MKVLHTFRGFVSGKFVMSQTVLIFLNRAGMALFGIPALNPSPECWLCFLRQKRTPVLSYAEWTLSPTLHTHWSLIVSILSPFFFGLSLCTCLRGFRLVLSPPQLQGGPTAHPLQSEHPSPSHRDAHETHSEAVTRLSEVSAGTTCCWTRRASGCSVGEAT